MKVLLPVFILLFTCVINAQTPLTNQDVVNLVKSGLSDGVVVAKIKQSGGNFDTTPSSLTELKAAQISETVILAMIETSSTKPANGADSTESPNADEIVIKDGTRVELELAYTVSSADLHEGDAVSFLVVQPVQVDGVTVIDRGAPATARVTKAEGGKSWGRGGQLTWSIQHVTAIDGQKIPLHFTAGTKGNGAPGTMTTGLVLTGLVFWPAAPLWGFKKGKPAIIPAGKRFEVFVHGDSAVRSAAVAVQPPKESKENKAKGQPTRSTAPYRSSSCYENGRKVPCP